MPGSGESIYLGDDWQSRAQSAHGRAVKACDYEPDNYVVLAGEGWQKIFGQQIPRVLSQTSERKIRLAHHDEYKWFTGVCALLAGFSPAFYKALDFDVSLTVVAQPAHAFKILLRQAWRLEALGPFPSSRKNSTT